MGASRLRGVALAGAQGGGSQRHVRGGHLRGAGGVFDPDTARTHYAGPIAELSDLKT